MKLYFQPTIFEPTTGIVCSMLIYTTTGKGRPESVYCQSPSAHCSSIRDEYIFISLPNVGCDGDFNLFISAPQLLDVSVEFEYGRMDNMRSQLFRDYFNPNSVNSPMTYPRRESET